MILFRIALICVGLLLTVIVNWIIPGDWYNSLYFSIGFLVASYALTWIAGGASRGVALRKVIGATGSREMPDPVPPTPNAPGTPNAKAWYIESVRPEKGKPHSCSFVEFDERGDYLDFHQHVHAYEKIKSLAEENEHLIVVFFVHGWRNNGHSGNVVSFNEFLHQLATYSDESGIEHRVHGVYLSWRGGCLKHAISLDKTYQDVTARYGGDPIVDLDQAARFPAFNEHLETFSYFDRKGVPEHLFSGTSFSRTLFTCAHVAKRFQPKGYVFLIGHSLGGLMLERTFQNACIGELTKAWPWSDPKLIETTRANPLPFDTLLLVNSAAPSIYAKQFQSYLAAHRQAMSRDNIVGANSPVFFSLTSSGDWATGKTHPIANTFCFLVPTLRRNYQGDDFILAREAGTEGVSIQQSFYYRHTPGHNPLLVNRFIERIGTSAEGQPEAAKPSKHLHANLHTSGESLEFVTSPRHGEAPMRWKINFPPATKDFDDFSKYEANGRSYRPVVWEKNSAGLFAHRETAYWIVRCPEEIIKDHNDIWSQQAMDTYAALYAISLKLRGQRPNDSGDGGDTPAA